MPHNIKFILTAAAAMLLALPLWAASPADQAAAKASVEKTYGVQVRGARSTPGKDDDLKLATTMLSDAMAGTRPPSVAAEVAKIAMELATDCPGNEAADIARDAMTRWADLSGATGAQRADAVLKIYQTQYDDATGPARKATAERLVEAIMDAYGAAESAGDLDKAAGAVTRAMDVAQSAGIKEVIDELTRASAQLQKTRAFKRDLEEAQVVVNAAQAGGEAGLIKGAQEKLGLLYLLRSGDPAAAADALVAAGHEWGPGAALLKKRAAGGALTLDEQLKVAAMLQAAMNRADVNSRGDLALIQLGLCDDLAGLAKGDPEKLKQVEAYRLQAKGVIDKEPPANAAERLRKSIGALAGTMTINPDGSIRLRYSFSGPHDMKDWSVRGGTWTSDNGQLAAAGTAVVMHNVRFQADKPMEVSFAVSGDGQEVAVIAPDTRVDRVSANAHLLIGVAAGGNGWETGGMGAAPTVNQTDKLAQPCRVRITSDGASTFTWSVNGKALATAKATEPLKGQLFRVMFHLRGGQMMQVSELRITGTPVPASQVTSAPSAQPAPPTPPRPGPPVRRPSPRGG